MTRRPEELPPEPAAAPTLALAFIRCPEDEASYHWHCLAEAQLPDGARLVDCHLVRELADLEAMRAWWVGRGGDVVCYARSQWDKDYVDGLAREVATKGRTAWHQGLGPGPYRDSPSLLRLGLSRHVARPAEPHLQAVLDDGSIRAAVAPLSVSDRVTATLREAQERTAREARQARLQREREELAQLVRVVAEASPQGGTLFLSEGTDASAFLWLVPPRAERKPHPSGDVAYSKRCALVRMADPDRPLWTGTFTVDGDSAYPSPLDAIRLIEKERSHASP